MHVIPYTGHCHYYDKHSKEFFLILVKSVTKLLLYLVGVPPAPHPKKRTEPEGVL